MRTDKVFDVVLDFVKSSSISRFTDIKFNQGDQNTAYIRIKLENNGNLFDLTEWRTIVNIEKPNGTVVSNDCNTIDEKNGILEVPLSIQSLASEGVSFLEIVAQNKDKRLVTTRVAYKVNRTLENVEEIISSSEFGTILNLIDMTKDAISDYEDMRDDVLITTEEMIEFNKTATSSENIRLEDENIRIASEVIRVKNEDGRLLEEDKRKASMILNQKTFDDMNTFVDNKMDNVDITMEEVNRTNADTLVVKNNTEAVRLDTLQVKNDTTLVKNDTLNVKEDTLQVKNKTDAVRDDTLRIKNETIIVRDDTLEVKNDTLEVKNSTIIVRDDTLEVKAQAEGKITEVNRKISEVEKVKNDTLAVKNETIIVRDDTLEVKNDTLEVKNSTINVKDATNTVKIQAENKILDVESRMVIIEDNFDSLVGGTGFAKIEYVDTKVASLVDSSPEALNTLNELARALGNDPNFATTVTNQISTKANKVDVYTKNESDNLLRVKAQIDDSVTSTLSVWSGSKVKGELDYIKENMATDALSTSYDNTSSGMVATNVQDAVNELFTSLNGARLSLIETSNKISDLV